MNIHQMQVRYLPGPDRVLWQLRTSAGDLYAVWLTRRMLLLLWPPLTKLVTHGAVAQVMPHATVMPEAQAMLAQAALERPLPGASFKEPFITEAKAEPLGPEPLLPEAVDLGPGEGGQGLKIQLRETGGRSLAMQLSDDLSTALLRLLEQALAGAGWGGPFSATGAVTGTASPDTPKTLN